MEYNQNIDRRKIKRFFATTMLGGKCITCGTTKKLEFDHIDSKTKEFNIVHGLSKPWSALVEELAKCQLLCKKCHEIKTWSLDNRKRAKHGTPSMYTNNKCRCNKCRIGWNNYHKNKKNATLKSL